MSRVHGHPTTGGEGQSQLTCGRTVAQTGRRCKPCFLSEHRRRDMATPTAAAPPTTARTGSTFDREPEERLVRYTRIDTQADETSTSSPSTEKQFDLLRPLAAELKSIGAEDVRLTDYGVVLATIP